MPDETQAPSTFTPASSPSAAPVVEPKAPEDDVEKLEAAGFRKVHGVWRR